MKISDIQSNNKSKNDLEQKEKLDMLLNDNSDSYQINRFEKQKTDNSGSKTYISYEESKNSEDIIPPKTLKRSNSIKLYKKHKKEKEAKDQIKNESTKSIKNNDNNDNIYIEAENDNKSKNIKENKSTKNLKTKKVTFLEPNFLVIINVESYKKFNAENTCKDPFEDMDLGNNIINNINYSNYHKNDKDEDEKERVNCSCSCLII